MGFEVGQRLHIPDKGLPEWVTVDFAQPVATGWKLYVKDSDGTFHPVDLTEAEAKVVTVVSDDGAADSARVLAGLWTQWMAAAGANANATLLASVPASPVRPSVECGLRGDAPPAELRFLLADEPGTGKTIMAGLYLREMQRLGLVSRALVVAPAGLVTKWQADFARFFGGELRRITNDTIQQHGLSASSRHVGRVARTRRREPSVQEAIDRTGRVGTSWCSMKPIG